MDFINVRDEDIMLQIWTQIIIIMIIIIVIIIIKLRDDNNKNI